MTEQLALPFAWGERGGFDHFVPGRNRELIERLQRSNGAFDCLWLFGEPGTGKTHLLQAVCNAQANSAYIPSRDIGAQDNWIDAYRTFATVAIDDVTEWIGVEASERALMDLYNRLRQRGARLILTADRSPRDIRFAVPDLSSRLCAAACYRVAALDDRDKLRMLATVAAVRGIELPDAIGHFLLARLSRDQRELLDVLERLDQASLVQGRRLTIPFVKETLRL